MRITKLNNVDMSTYGLDLVRYEGDLDLSARKRTTSVWNTTLNDIMFEDKKITFYFRGKYANEIDVGDAISAFTSNLQSVIEGSVETQPPNYDLTHPKENWVGRFVNGAQIQISYGNSVFITLVMTWQGKRLL